MRRLLALALLPLSLACHAEDWIPIALIADGTMYSAQPGSLVVSKDADPQLMAVFKADNPAKAAPGLFTESMPASACAAGHGALLGRPLDGSRPVTTGFAFGSGTVASDIAQALCDAYAVRMMPAAPASAPTLRHSRKQTPA